MSESHKFRTILKKLEPFDNQTIHPQRRNSQGNKPDVQISSRLREGVQEAVQLLKREEGYIVAFPTETVYGLGADIFNDRAIKKIFEAKKRPQDNPLIVHISRIDMLKSISTFPFDDQDDSSGSYPSLVRKLIERFWPGPLTILFPASDAVSVLIRGGEVIKTVAVRMPNNPIALALIDELGSPICAPSANISGKPSPTTAQHVMEDLSGEIPFILDGGPTHYGLESTVIDVSSSPPTILRPGAVPIEQLRDFLPDIQVYNPPLQTSVDITLSSSLGLSLDHSDQWIPPTPGMKYKHYSPNARVVLLEPSNESDNELTTSLRAVPFLENIIQQHLVQNSLGTKRLAIACSTRTKRALQTCVQSLFESSNNQDGFYCQLYDMGDDASQIAHRLFATLRQVDRDRMELVYVEGLSDSEVGMAVMNRLKKAASDRIILT